MGVGFAAPVCWRASKRGLVIGGVEGDALLLEHPRAGDLPELLADRPAPEVLAERLGAPHADTLVAEMIELGILSADTPGPAARRAPSAERSRRRVVWTRSGAEFPGIDRPARWLDRYVVPHLLSWPGRLVLGATLVAGVMALAVGRPDAPAVSPHPVWEVVLGLVVMLVMSAAHELAHAVALVHYGRRPRRAGFGFYWGGISFYVDSTEALTLARRARVTQALVGLAVDAVVIALLALTAQLAGSVLLVVLCWRLAVMGVADLVVNTLPILEVDGHWALADHLDEPELAPRARVALGATVRRACRRRPGPTIAWGADDRWLAFYGAVSLIGGFALLAGSAVVWWAVASDLAAALFAGDAAEVLVGVLLVGPVVLGLLVSTAGLVLETVLAEPAPTT